MSLTTDEPLALEYYMKVALYSVVKPTNNMWHIVSGRIRAVTPNGLACNTGILILALLSLLVAHIVPLPYGARIKYICDL